MTLTNAHPTDGTKTVCFIAGLQDHAQTFCHPGDALDENQQCKFCKTAVVEDFQDMKLKSTPTGMNPQKTTLKLSKTVKT